MIMRNHNVKETNETKESVSEDDYFLEDGERTGIAMSKVAS